MEKRTIFYIVAIIIVLIILFLSQQAFSRNALSGFFSPQKDIVNGVISQTADRAAAYLSKGSEWVASSVFEKLGGEVAERGEAIKNGIEEQKNNISENILDKTKNYFSGIANSIVNPGASNSCSTSQTSASQ